MAFPEVHLFFVACILLLTSVNLQEPVVVPNVIVPGGSFIIYCDASRVRDLGFSVTSITKLALLYKKAEADGEPTVIVQYSAIGLPNISAVPPGRLWEIKMDGGYPSNSNKGAIYSKVLIEDAKCEDVGTYICSVSYLLNNIELTETVWQNATGASSTKCSKPTNKSIGTHYNLRLKPWIFTFICVILSFNICLHLK